MARKAKPKLTEQVKPGDLIALPLDDGRWIACLVLRKNGNQALVRGTEWIGGAPPADVSSPLLRKPLVLTHHAWGGQTFEQWIKSPVPAVAVPLGRVTLSDEEATAQGPSFEVDVPSSPGFGGWERFRVQAQMQWAAQAPWAVTLEVLRKRTSFPDWRDNVEAEELRTSRRIVRDLIDELIALSQDGDEVSKLDAFLRAVQRFNETDFIGTEEREDIGELFDRIAEAVGLTDYDVTAWRDW